MNEEARPKRPRWSIFSMFVFFSVFSIGAAVFLCFTGDRPLWVDLELTISLCGAVLFFLYWWILFHGIRIDKKENFDITLVKMPDFSGLDIGYPGVSLELFDFIGGLAELGPLGIIIAIPLVLITAIAAAIVLAVLAYVLFYLGINVTLISIFIVATPLFFVFKRSILFVLRHQVSSHRRPLVSARWALFYAAPKTIFLYLVVYLAHRGYAVLS